MEKLPTQEKIRIPEVSRRAALLLDAIEQATPECPISLDVATQEEGGWNALLQTQLERTDSLYDQHDEIFDLDGVEHFGMYGRSGPEFRDAIKVSLAAAQNAKGLLTAERATFLALGIAQIAKVAKHFCEQSNTFISPEGNSEKFAKAFAAESMGLAKQHFWAEKGPSFYGDVKKLPASRFSYPGLLLDIHLAFWREVAKSPEDEVPADVNDDLQRFILQLPAKYFSLGDIHSRYGRVDRHLMRQRHVLSMQAFQESLQAPTNRLPTGEGNIAEATLFAHKALDTFRRQGYSLEECLQLAVTHSADIGNITKLTTMGWPILDGDVWRLTENLQGLELQLLEQADPFTKEPIFTDKTLGVLNRRNRVGGGCAARNFVEINKNSETYADLQVLHGAVANETGVDPPLFTDTQDGTYIHPATLFVNYALLATVRAG